MKELDNFVTSDDRLRFIQQLAPWLESPSQITFAQDRLMHDAFSELCVVEGETARPKPPPVWKLTIIIVLGLMMCVWPINENVGPVLQKHGLKSWSSTLILTGINVFLNTYICVPFCMFMFGGWLHSPRDPKGYLSVFLDRGFPNIYCQFFVALLYFGGLASLIATDAIFCLDDMKGVAKANGRC